MHLHGDNGHTGLPLRWERLHRGGGEADSDLYPYTCPLVRIRTHIHNWRTQAGPWERTAILLLLGVLSIVTAPPLTIDNPLRPGRCII